MRWIIIHIGIVYNVFSVRVRAFVPLSAPCGVRVRHPLVFSGTQNCTLSCSVCVFAVWRGCKAPSRVQWYPKTAPSRVQCVFLLPAAYTIPSKREKSLPLERQTSSLSDTFACISRIGGFGFVFRLFCALLCHSLDWCTFFCSTLLFDACFVIHTFLGRPGTSY